MYENFPEFSGIGRYDISQTGIFLIRGLTHRSIVDVCADVMDVGEGIAGETAIKADAQGIRDL